MIRHRLSNVREKSCQWEQRESHHSLESLHWKQKTLSFKQAEFFQVIHVQSEGEFTLKHHGEALK